MGLTTRQKAADPDDRHQSSDLWAACNDRSNEYKNTLAFSAELK